MQSLLEDPDTAPIDAQQPGIHGAAVVTLAIGIGANSAIFSLINVLALKPLPITIPRLVGFSRPGPEAGTAVLRDGGRLPRYPAASRTLSAVSAYSYVSANLTGGDSRSAPGLPRHGQYVRLLGVPAAHGRCSPATERPRARCRCRDQ